MEWKKKDGKKWRKGNGKKKRRKKKYGILGGSILWLLFLTFGLFLTDHMKIFRVTAEGEPGYAYLETKYLLPVFSKNIVSKKEEKEMSRETEQEEENLKKEGNLKKEENLKKEGNLKKEEISGEKIAYLTFDDGPSDHSDQLLDILKEEKVKATFFVIANENQEMERVYQRIVKEGHGLGIHSYSHVYSEIYSSLEAYQQDVWKLKTFLYHVTGVSCDIYRFPGGSKNSTMKIPVENCIAYLEEKNIAYFDWNASADDAICVGTDPGILLTRVLKDALKYDKTVILMHDLNCCETTLNMVRPLIHRLKREGYSFDRLTHETEPIHQ